MRDWLQSGLELGKPKIIRLRKIDWDQSTQEGSNPMGVEGPTAYTLVTHCRCHVLRADAQRSIFDALVGGTHQPDPRRASARSEIAGTI
jgi:hypothetical protein